MRSNKLFFTVSLLVVSTIANAQTAQESCGCEDKLLPAVIATVNGAKISAETIDAQLRDRLQQLRKPVIDARKAELDQQINSMLLDAEAKKRGISAARLLNDEVVSKARVPTEAEALIFYEQNKAQIQGQFAELKKDIISFLMDRRQQELAKGLAARLRAAADVKILAQVITPPTTPADRTRVFATVNGKNITSADVEEGLRPLIFMVKERTYEMRKQQIDLEVNDLLLSQEAQKRGITAKELLEREVDAKLQAVSEETAQKFYNENKERINGEFAVIKAQIIRYLTKKQSDDRSEAFAQELRSKAAVQIFLTPPEVPVYDIATDDQPSKGNPNANVTLVEFTDYQCPSCSQQHPVLERLLAEYGDRVRLVVRDFPLSQHEHAAKAAEAAEAAREQGKYWEFIALLYSRQSALQPEKLKEYATELGLDRERFDAALASNKFTDKVQRDLLDGQKLGVGGTPTLYLNGKRISDRSYEGLKASIEEALKPTR